MFSFESQLASGHMHNDTPGCLSLDMDSVGYCFYDSLQTRGSVEVATEKAPCMFQLYIKYRS